MLAEIKNVRQIPGEGFRRWFRDDYFDLIIWYDDEMAIFGFQLCYDKEKDEHSLTWKRSGHISHDKVDTGESGMWGPKSTPVLMADGPFPYEEISDRFKRVCENVDENISEFILKRLRDYETIQID